MIEYSKLIALEEELTKRFPQFVIKKTLMLNLPVDHLLRGVSFEGSVKDSTSFFMDVFIMPLCVPSDHIVLTFGGRLQHSGGSDRWDINMPNLLDNVAEVLQRDGIPPLSDILTPLDFAELTTLFGDDDVRVLESRAYALARGGQIDVAIETIDLIFANLEPEYDWHHDLLAELSFLKNLLIADPIAAQHQLAKWEAFTIHSLGIESFRAQ